MLVYVCVRAREHVCMHAGMCLVCARVLAQLSVHVCLRVRVCACVYACMLVSQGKHHTA